MLKNHLSKNRTNPQTETPSMPSTHTHTLGEREGNSSQRASMSSNEPEDDDDDICPVCESECTCANRTRNVASPPANNYPTGYLAQDVSKGGPSARPPSLKIKLTLSARSYTSPTTRASSNRSSFPKRKSKHAIQSALAAGSASEDLPGTSQRSAHGETLTTGGARDIQDKNHVSIPKKRGRPTKAAIAARETEKNASEVKQAKEVTRRQSIGNVVVARQSKSSFSRRAHQVNTSTTKKGRKLHGAAAASRARAQQRKTQKKTEDRKGKRQATVDEDESSELSELDDDDDHPFGLPTFVPALSSSSNCSSSDSDEDTDSDCDKGIPPYPLPQHPTPLPLVDNEHVVQRRREYHNTWDIRVRKRSVGADGDSDAGMDTESGDEEEEGDDEADADENDEDEDEESVQPAVRYSGIATGWTDDEESSFDADIFFANLSDSSSESSDDEHTGNVSVVLSGTTQDSRTGASSTTGLDLLRLSEAASAGFLAPFAELERATGDHTPFGQGWEGFMDLDIDLSPRLPLGSLLEPPIPGYEEAEAVMATSEEEEAVAVMESCSRTLDEDEVLEIFEDSDGGETTEDEFVDVDGIATPRREVLLRFPASLGAIDPMSTVSSPVRGREHQEKTSTPISASRKSTRLRLKQVDFSSGRASLREKPVIVEPRPSNLPPRQATSAPAMGCFIPDSSKTGKHAVIPFYGKNSSKVLPCPYPAVRRLRGRGTSVSMFSRSGSDRSHRSRTPSLLATTRSPLETWTAGDFDSPDDTQLPLGEPIQLDDIIDAKLLEPERSDVTMPESAASETGEALEMTETCESDSERGHHLANLRRWDTIPIDAFRKTRTYSTENDLTDNLSMVIGTPRAPRPSDGFSYGSAAGGVMRGSPAALWGSNVLQPPSSPSENRRGKLSSLLVSPILLPVRDGDRTPTAERQHQRQQQQQQRTYSGFASQHAAYTQQNIKSRKELRKEKKRNRKAFASATSHVRHNHFPNAKSRATSSMQRIPSLNL